MRPRLTHEQQQLFDPDPLLDKDAAATRLGVTGRFINRLVSEHRIEYVKVGRHVRFRSSVIEQYIQKHTVRAAS